MTSSDPHGHHDWHSRDYVDHWIASDATRDEDRRPMLERMVSNIPHPTDARIRVLDVGAGYGLLSRCVLARFPAAQLVCQDFSSPMLERARDELADSRDRVEYVMSDLMTPDWTAPLTHRFDAVVSAIAIHNVRHPERIHAIYREIRDLLAPGGCFLNYDLTFSEQAGASLDTQIEWLAATGLSVKCLEQAGRVAVIGAIDRSSGW